VEYKCHLIQTKGFRGKSEPEMLEEFLNGLGEWELGDLFPTESGFLIITRKEEKEKVEIVVGPKVFPEPEPKPVQPEPKKKPEPVTPYKQFIVPPPIPENLRRRSFGGVSTREPKHVAKKKRK